MLPCIGHRSELYDSLNPDWAPSLFIDYKGIAILRTNPASEASAATCTAAMAGHSSTLVATCTGVNPDSTTVQDMSTP